jgi:hypothetical protein
MRRAKIDGVVEAVRYAPDGKIAWVRAYERRGPTFSDHVLIDRETLLQYLKAGKHYFAGQRKQFLGGSFELKQPLRVVPKDGGEAVVTADAPADQDHLAGVPVL